LEILPGTFRKFNPKNVHLTSKSGDVRWVKFKPFGFLALPTSDGVKTYTTSYANKKMMVSHEDQLFGIIFRIRRNFLGPGFGRRHPKIEGSWAMSHVLIGKPAVLGYPNFSETPVDQ
jgi:hypothetical protein